MQLRGNSYGTNNMILNGNILRKKLIISLSVCSLLSACSGFIKTKDFLGKNIVDDSKLSIAKHEEVAMPKAPQKKFSMSLQDKIIKKAKEDKTFFKSSDYGLDIEHPLDETSIDFDEASLADVIDTFADLMGMNIILSSGVNGKITVKTRKKFKLRDSFKILHSILEVNGLTTVKVGSFYKIIPIAQAKQYPIEMHIGKSPKTLDNIEKAVTQIIPLENIAVADAVKIINPLLSKGGSIITHKDTNIMIVNDLSSNIIRLLRLINVLDVASEMGDESRVYVYYVKSKKASDLSTTLNSIYKKSSKKNKKIPTRKAPTRVKGKTKRKTVYSASPSLSDIEGEVKFVADKEINALIIKTTPRIYPEVLKIIKKLDIMPRQVLIEVLIADITLNDSISVGTSFGKSRNGVGEFGSDAIEELGINAGGIDLTTALTGIFGGSGIRYAIGKKNAFMGAVTALAEKGKAKVLASPHLVTTDNKVASVSFGEQIPIPTNAITGAAGNVNSNVIQTSIQYKDVSTKLEVTPNINQNGQVTMEVSQEISELGTCPANSDGSKNFAQCPINKRTLKSTVVVQSGQTLVLGGLIKENKRLSQSGVPLLMDIPILGRLFSSSSWSTNRSEVVLLITPHVIAESNDINVVTDSFKGRVKHFLGDEKKKKEEQKSEWYRFSE